MLNKYLILTFLTSILFGIEQTVQAQLMDNSLFRIYRAVFIQGTVTQLRLDSNNLYQIKVIEIHCSICDHDELIKTINSNGRWKQLNDTIYLDESKKLLIIGDSVIKPFFIIGINTHSLSEEKKQKLEDDYINSNLNEFHLVYDTYPDGVVKLIVDKYRMRRNEYEIEFNHNGSIKELRYYLDNKQRNRIK